MKYVFMVIIGVVMCNFAYCGGWDNAKNRAKSIKHSDFGKNAIIVARVLSPTSLFFSLLYSEVKKDIKKNYGKPIKKKW